MATGLQQDLPSFHQAHTTRLRQLALTSAQGLSKDIDIDYAVFLHSNSGASVWWAFGPIWKEVGADGGRSSWDAWWRKLQPMQRCTSSWGLPSSHVRCGVGPGKAIGSLGDRVLPFHALSSHALVGLLAKWACSSPNKGGLRSLAGRSAARIVLLSIIRLGFPDGSSCPMDIYLDCDAGWEPPSFPEGQHGLRVVVSSGLWDHCMVLRSLPAPDSIKGLPSMHKCVAALGQVQGKLWQLADFLIFALEEPGLNAWLGKQLVWNVGSRIDGTVRASVLSDTQPGGSSTDDLQWAAGGLGKAGSWQQWRQKELNLLRYTQAAKKLFGIPLNLSTSLDAARVSGRKTICAVVAEPGGHAVIAPPQATGARLKSKGWYRFCDYEVSGH